MDNTNIPELNDKLSISDIYYNKKIDWMANMMLKNEEITDGRVIKSYSIKMGERRTTIHK